eukprot:g6589.t1
MGGGPRNVLKAIHECYTPGVRLARELGNHRTEVNMLGNTGMAYLDAGMLDEAKEPLCACLSAIRKHGDFTIRGNSLKAACALEAVCNGRILLGIQLFKSKQYAQAAGYLERVVSDGSMAVVQYMWAGSVGHTMEILGECYHHLWCTSQTTDLLEKAERMLKRAQRQLTKDLGALHTTSLGNWWSDPTPKHAMHFSLLEFGNAALLKEAISKSENHDTDCIEAREKLVEKLVASVDDPIEAARLRGASLTMEMAVKAGHEITPSGKPGMLHLHGHACQPLSDMITKVVWLPIQGDDQTMADEERELMWDISMSLRMHAREADEAISVDLIEFLRERYVDACTSKPLRSHMFADINGFDLDDARNTFLPKPEVALSIMFDMCRYRAGCQAMAGAILAGPLLESFGTLATQLQSMTRLLPRLEEVKSCLNSVTASRNQLEQALFDTLGRVMFHGSGL